MLKRRDALLTGLFGTGYVGLRAMATGLPAWFILNPRKANAQSLQCAITNQATMQYLLVSANFNGDPINCNCPGTYATGGTTVANLAIHPTQEEVSATTVSLGGVSYGAALPWADPSVVVGASKGQLKSATLARTSFFHHLTASTVHGDQPKVMKLMGKTSGNEMLVSAFAKHLAPCFNTVQPEPIAVGAGRNGAELVSFSGRTLPSIAPTQLKQLLTGSKTDPLVKLRTVRDTTIDKLNTLAKSDGTGAQKAFLDAMALSQTQVRKLADQLSTTLASITSDNVQGQALAAAALFAANVTPVVTMRIAFGGDNHTDTNLQAEADQHVSGIAGIQQVMDALAGLSLSDKVTFATLNVFGRNLNSIAKAEARAGRDHYGNHAVMVMIGKNIKPGVIGGLTTPTSGNALQASAIDSATGAASASGD
ncbi:MAG TPA: DUF1501 domain-containing protein, partial [Polyangia bacterium]|nr:DUF1501 domain-containing protein [Polyangia bacterium]